MWRGQKRNGIAGDRIKQPVAECIRWRKNRESDGDGAADGSMERLVTEQKFIDGYMKRHALEHPPSEWMAVDQFLAFFIGHILRRVVVAVGFRRWGRGTP